MFAYSVTFPLSRGYHYNQGCLYLQCFPSCHGPGFEMSFWETAPSILVTFLPETSDHKLPDTIEEGEELGKGDTLYSWLGGMCRRGRGNKYTVKRKESNANGSVEA